MYLAALPTWSGWALLLRKPHDAIYALMLPFRDFSFVLRVECEDHGLTGVREAVVLAEFLKVGSEDMEGWAADLYEPSLRTEPLRNIEDEKYDAKFPDHPFSRVGVLRTQGRAVITRRVQAPTK